MCSIHPHAKETGHKLIISGRSDEWDGFCFDCCLQYIFSEDESVSAQQRFEVMDLLNNCVETVEAEVNLDNLYGAMIEQLALGLCHQRVDAAGVVFAFSAANRLKVSARVASRPAAVVSTLRDLLRKAERCLQAVGGDKSQKQLCTALNCRIVRKAIAHTRNTAVSDFDGTELSGEALKLLLQLVKAGSRRDGGDSLQTDVSAALLRTECISCVSAILTHRKDDFSRNNPLPGSAEQLVDFIATELSSNYTAVLSRLNTDPTDTIATTSADSIRLDVISTTSYRIHLFQLLSALVESEETVAGFGAEVIAALLSKKGRSYLVPQLARAAVKLCQDAHTDETVQETSHHHLAGLHCILSLLQASARCDPAAASEPSLAALAQRLLADDCHYSSQLFGLWSGPTSSNSAVHSDPDPATGLEALVLRTFHALALGCPTRFFHYSVFTARVFGALLQRFESAVQHCIFLRRLGVDVLPVLGGDMVSNARDPGQIVGTAIARGACGEHMLCAAHRCCKGLIDRLSPREKNDNVEMAFTAPGNAAAAVVAALAQTLPLVRALQEAQAAGPATKNAHTDSETEKGAASLGFIAASSLALLADALLQLPPAVSAHCGYERDTAVRYCLRCINHDNSDIWQRSDAIQQLQVIVSHVCAQNAALVPHDDSPTTTTALTAPSESQFARRDEIMEALLALLAGENAAHSPVTEALCSRGYDCRSLHRMLAVYVLSPQYAGVSDTYASSTHTRIRPGYARFIALCCKELASGCLAADMQVLQAVEDTLSHVDQFMAVMTVSVVEAVASVCRLVASMVPREQEMGCCALFLSTCLGCTEDALQGWDCALTPSTAQCGNTGRALLLLWLTQLDDPRALCQTHWQPLRWVVDCCMAGTAIAHSTAAPVLFTFDLLLSAEQRSHVWALAVVPASAQEVAYYWSCCALCSDNQSNRPAAQSFAATMLSLLWERILSLGGTQTDFADAQPSAALAELLLQLVQCLPLSAFVDLLPVLTEAAEVLCEATSAVEAATVVWTALVTSLEKHQVYVQMRAMGAEGNQGKRKNTGDDALMILQRAGWFLQMTPDAHDECTGASQEGEETLNQRAAATGELRRAVRATSIRMFNTEACLRLASCGGVCDRSAGMDSVEELREYLQRSGWWQLLRDVTERPLSQEAEKEELSADRILREMLIRALGAGHCTDASLLCSVLEDQLRGDQSGSTSLAQSLAQMSRVGFQGSHLQQTGDAAARHCASSLLGALYCCEEERVDGRDTSTSSTHSKVDALLRCWLLRAQEVLLACTGALQVATSPGDVNTNSSAAAVRLLREVQRCTMLYCSAHLHSQRLRSPQVPPQAWHLLWVCPGSTSAAAHAAGVYEIAQDQAYSERCGEMAQCRDISQLRYVVRGLVLERAVPLQGLLTRLQAQKCEGTNSAH